VLHFQKLEQQRKIPKEKEASRRTKYNRGSHNTSNFDNTTKHVNNIDSDGCEPLKNWEKFFGPPQAGVMPLAKLKQTSELHVS
jgi:hypothetical protein